jgi:Mg-chelatase subunit ChlD
MSDLVLKQKLESSLVKGSLASLVQARKAQRTVMFLIDCSGSMNYPLVGGGTRMSALREVMRELAHQGHSRQMVSIGGYGPVGFLTHSIPEPSGSTPLAEAIEFAHFHGAGHLIVISDGEPNDPEHAMHAAQQFGGPIDVFFVGDAGSQGEQFLQQLARHSGGKLDTISLDQPKQLEAKLKGLLAA